MTPLQHTIQSIENKIALYEKRKAELKKYLPYADGPAWTQDQDRIRSLETEIASLYNVLTYWQQFKQYDEEAA